LVRRQTKYFGAALRHSCGHWPEALKALAP